MTSFQVSVEEHLHVMLSPPCFTMWIVLSGRWAVFHWCSTLYQGQKVQYWCHLTREPFFICSQNKMCVWTAYISLCRSKCLGCHCLVNWVSTWFVIFFFQHLQSYPWPFICCLLNAFFALTTGPQLIASSKLLSCCCSIFFPFNGVLSWTCFDGSSIFILFVYVYSLKIFFDYSRVSHSMMQPPPCFTMVIVIFE